MPQFGEKSRVQLSSIHPKLQRLLCTAIKYVDFSIIEGHRLKERQEQLFTEGKTKTMQSRHLSYPSEAADIAPSPYPDLNNPKDIKQIYYLQGIIAGIALMMDLKIRFGGDWDQNFDIRNDDFQDSFHIELDRSEV